MARPDELVVTPSVLDRLIDMEPRQAEDSPSTRAQSVRRLRLAVRRDLEWLLNTRRNPDEAPESLAELSQSVYNYGLPDFSAVSLNSPKDRDWLLVEVERTVALFEPRLKDVRVTLLDTPGVNRVLHFQIEGMLQMDPAPEQVSFDTVLQLTNGEYQIRGDRGA
ncbi:MAG TPA: type VI secretion system baseplate subunit TssE [Bryobacteraceae bacterium]|nr:type VI secretion system baseplate subunit TssE [Bryobacteraceae bacterium]